MFFPCIVAGSWSSFIVEEKLYQRDIWKMSSNCPYMFCQSTPSSQIKKSIYIYIYRYIFASTPMQPRNWMVFLWTRALFLHRLISGTKLDRVKSRLWGKRLVKSNCSRIDVDTLPSIRIDLYQCWFVSSQKSIYKRYLVLATGHGWLGQVHGNGKDQVEHHLRYDSNNAGSNKPCSHWQVWFVLWLHPFWKKWLIYYFFGNTISEGFRPSSWNHWDPRLAKELDVVRDSMEKSFKKLAHYLTTLKMDGVEKLDPKNAKLVEFLDCTHNLPITMWQLKIKSPDPCISFQLFGILEFKGSNVSYIVVVWPRMAISASASIDLQDDEDDASMWLRELIAANRATPTIGISPPCVPCLICMSGFVYTYICKG